MIRRSLFAASLSLFACASLALTVPFRSVSAQRSGDGGGGKLSYPVTKKVDQVDDYFGTKVADPYRWLENNDSPEVAAWVAAENKVTYQYLDQIPYRKPLFDRLSQLYNYP